MFLSEKVRIFRTQSSKENSLVSKRSEFRLKSVASCRDVRTWSFDREDRRRAFLESVNNPGSHFGNYIPFNELLLYFGIKGAVLLRETGAENREIKVQAIIESYNKMKLHLEKLIPVAIEKDNLEGEIVQMSETIKDLTKVISYQDNEINRLINILQSNQEVMLLRQEGDKPKNDFCQMMPPADENDQMCLHMISVNSDDKNQQLYFYQLQISLNQERKNFNKLLKLLRIEQETRKNIQQELNKQLRRATELAVERDLLRKTLQYNEKTVQRYMLESETEKEKAKLLERSLSVLEQQLERIEKSLQTDIENCKTLQSQQIVDKIQKHIKDSKKLNKKLLSRNRQGMCYTPSRSDTELYKPCSRMSKIVLAKREVIRTTDYDNEEDERIKYSCDRIYKNRNTQYTSKIRKPMNRSSESLSKCVMKQTSIILEQSVPENCGKPYQSTSKIKIHNERCTTVTPCIEELFKRLQCKPQRSDINQFSAEQIISKISLGKTRSKTHAKDECCDSENSVDILNSTKSSTTKPKKSSSLFKQKDSNTRIPSKHKTDTRKSHLLNSFYPKDLQLQGERRKDDSQQSERKKVDRPVKMKASKSSAARKKEAQTGLLDKFYPKGTKSTSSLQDELKTLKKSVSMVISLPKSVSSCNINIQSRLATTRARLQEIYDKYSDYKNQFTKRSKTFILDKYSSTHTLPVEDGCYGRTSDESYTDLYKKYKNKYSANQKQLATNNLQNSRREYDTGDKQKSGRTRTTYFAVYNSGNNEMSTNSKLTGNNKPRPQKTTPTADKHFVCSSKHDLKTMKYEDGVTDSFYKDLSIDINCRYQDDSTSKDKYYSAHARKQETTPVYLKDLYKRNDDGGSDYLKTTSQDRLFTSKQSYLLEKPSYRQLSKYEGYYKTETSVTDFQNKDKKPLKYLDTVNENVIGGPTKYVKNKTARSSKKSKRKIKFETDIPKTYGYELPKRSKYYTDYSLPEKDKRKNVCGPYESNNDRQYNTNLSSSNKAYSVRRPNANYTSKGWEQTVLDHNDSNYCKDMFTTNRETSYQFLDRIRRQNASSYQNNTDHVYYRQDMPDLYEDVRNVYNQELSKPAVNDTYYQRPLDPYGRPDSVAVRKAQKPSLYSGRKAPNLTPSEYIDYLKAKHARRANNYYV